MLVKSDKPSIGAAWTEVERQLSSPLVDTDREGPGRPEPEQKELTPMWSAYRA